MAQRTLYARRSTYWFISWTTGIPDQRARVGCHLRGEAGVIATAGAVEPGDGAVRGEETRRAVLVGAAHDGHLGADVQPADVARAVRLPQHAVDVLGEVTELESQVQVHQAVAARLAVLVDPVVPVGDGHGVGKDAERAIELHGDGYG